jgi:predicted branched-subunit amino acid permease
VNDLLIWVLVGVVIVGGIVLGRMRGDPLILIGLDVAGYTVFLVGLYWASQVGREAFIAAGAACLGVLLFTTASNLRRQRPDLPARRD